MTFDAGSNSAQQGSAGATATQQGPVVPAQQGPIEGTQQAPVEAEATPEVTGPLAGDPLSLGLPAFIIGSVALGMVLIGFVSPLGTGASLPIILAATAAGLFISTFWAAAVGQSAVALVLGVFAGFWLSYAFLILGLTHGWFGVGIADVKASTELFLTAWVVIFSMLTLATLRLAAAFTAVIALVDVAVILVLIGVIQASPNLLKAGGATAFLFATVGIYIFFGTASIATGGKALPLGRPVLKS
jgi:succinate-acetate transporter protein